MIMDDLANFGEIDCGNANIFNFSKTIDLRENRDIVVGGGHEMAVRVQVTETFVTAGSARLNIGISYSDNENPALSANTYTPIRTGGSGITLALVAGAALTVGADPIYIPIPRPNANLAAGLMGRYGVGRYMAVSCWNDLAPGQAWTAGKVKAQLVQLPEGWTGVKGTILG